MRTRDKDRRGGTILCLRAISYATSIIPPSRKKVVTKARDKNHPATRNPISERLKHCPRCIISDFAIGSALSAACGNIVTWGGGSCASPTFPGLAIIPTLRTVEYRKTDQK